jgi:DNA-binding response OmpR family regulator
MKVLLIEDIGDQQSLIDTSLQQSGYSVDRVFDGNEAVARATNHAYDLIILDLKLSRDSSLLVLHEIREMNRDVEILILSTREQVRDRVTALIQGADDYLVKPFSSDDLQTRIQSLLNRRIAAKSSTDSSGHLNRLIENLLQLCRYESDGFELVISEIKLSNLFAVACSHVMQKAKLNDMVLRLPERELPCLLADARWMEHLLVNLLNYSISHSPARSEISLDFRAEVDYGTLIIEASLPVSPDDDDPQQASWKSRCVEVDADNQQPADPLSLARSYAHGMNLRLNTAITGSNRFQFQLSNIRII